MTFQNLLNDYILQAKCSSKELSIASGLSEGTISRYRKGHRVPGANSEHLKNLAAGLFKLLSEQSHDVNCDEIYNNLRKTVDTGLSVDYNIYVSKLKRLLRLFKISNNELGRKLNYDPSYISRILSGQRRPGDIRKFTNDVSYYIAFQKSDEFMPDSLAGFLGCSQDDTRSHQSLQNVIAVWLISAENAE